MLKRKQWMSAVVSCLLLMFLLGPFQATGKAAQSDKPITGKEWAAKIGLSWGSEILAYKTGSGWRHADHLASIHRSDEPSPLAG